MHLAFPLRQLPAAVLAALVTLACGPKSGGDDTGSTATGTHSTDAGSTGTGTGSTGATSTDVQECTPGDSKSGEGDCLNCVCSAAGQWQCDRCAPTSGSETTFETTLTTTGETSTTSPDGTTTVMDPDTVGTTTDDGTSTTGGGDVLPNCADLGEGDSFDINSAEVEGDLLVLEVGYGGGCLPHEFTLCFEGIVLDTSFIKLAVHHDAHGDVCEAFLTEERTLDLTPTQSFGPSPVDIQLLGWGPPLQYVF
ncbi:hypothetical protein [Nannocystis punicea]|uniref:Uncharacterized protein n=1 Tax=Nannocystis punicea TaxID=2995304 RepID=A0ABY7GUL8_9BACT|nr:hypothetical protein [Nannocystis poenicansa]WAS90648.1 hypothetical protein O0S08_31050 [Nannocystis poenicansa]